MTENEAKLILDVRISRFDHAGDVNEALEIAKQALEEIQQYREIGTVEECREAAEKQKPKKSVEDSCPDHTHYKCPSCGKIQKTKYGDSTFGCILNHCSNCGQALMNENSEENI